MHIIVQYVNEIVKLHKNKFDFCNHTTVKMVGGGVPAEGATSKEGQAFCIHLGPIRVTVSKKVLGIAIVQQGLKARAGVIMLVPACRPALHGNYAL
jgi:hypothetical protein